MTLSHFARTSRLLPLGFVVVMTALSFGAIVTSQTLYGFAAL